MIISIARFSNKSVYLEVKVDPVEPVAMPVGWSQNGGNATPMEPDLDWCRCFGSDELSNLVHNGQNNNYEIGAVVSRVRQAHVQATIAGAPLLPESDPSVGASRDISFSSGEASTNVSGMLQVGYEIDFWGKNRAGKQAAEASYRANVYDRETVALTVTSSIVSTYLKLLSLRDRL